MMTKYRNLIILVIISFISLGILLILNDIVIKIRFKELRIYLQKIDKKERSIDHIGLISKYVLNKKLYDGRISQDRADIDEFRVQDLLSGEKKPYRSIPLLEYKYLSIPAFYLINLNRFFLGKPPLKNLDVKTQDTKYLDLAYFYERNNMHKKALEYYEKVLYRGSVDKSIIGGILLHMGFCHALLGEFELAKKHYQLIMIKYKDENVAITASILQRYHELFHKEQLRVMKQSKDSIDKSIKLYRLLSFNKALEILKKREEKVSGKRLAQLQYFIARCYSGLGKPEIAVNKYLEIITMNPQSQYAKFSNRRIFNVGLRLGNDKIKKLSLRINSNIIKDDFLFENIIRREISPEIQYLTVSKDKEIKINDFYSKKIQKIIKSKKLFPYVEKMVQINTIDGNIFKGKLIESSKKSITIMAFFGKIIIQRNRIKKIKIQN